MHYQDRLKELNMYSLEDRTEKGDMTEAFKYIKGVNKVLDSNTFQCR